MKTLRRYEGEAVLRYFSQFNQLILRHKEDFSIDVRNRRPPLDRVNALFSFTYVLLIGMCAAALETVVGALCRIYAYRQAGQAFFGGGSAGRAQGSLCGSVCFILYQLENSPFCRF